MELQVIWKMFPVLMGALWVLGTFKFKFLQRGQINAWLGITAIAIHSNLVFYGYIEMANIVSALFILCMFYRSLHDGEVTPTAGFFKKWYTLICNKVKR